MDSISTGGRWLERASEMHINYLELKAAFFGLQAFVNEMRDVHIRVELDNTTAVSYINNFDGCKARSCNILALQIWCWCIERRIWLPASHIAGVNNTRADEESRLFSDNTEWMLNTKIFKQVISVFGMPDIDLFSSRLNNQEPLFVTRRPEPGSHAVDTFSIT